MSQSASPARSTGPGESSPRADARNVQRQSLVCPTCGARQVPADRCRRCQCDLTLVRQIEQQVHRLRRQCLAYLRERRLLPATRLARQCCQLSAEPANRRLLATCYLLRSNFAAATGLVQQPRQAQPARGAGQGS